MVLNAMIDCHDTSAYTPSICDIGEIFQQARRYKKLLAYTKEASALSSSDTHKVSQTGAAWAPSSYPSSQHFWRLSLDDISAIELALTHFQCMNAPLYAINPTTFPVTEALKTKFRSLVKAIYGDQQSVVLCGLDPARYSDVENVIIHTGISSHIGSQRGLAGREGGDNTAIHHITAMIACPRGSTGQYHGPPNQTREIPFHTDIGDIVSLYALSTSLSGGSFYLADSTTVYDDLAALKPELAECLTDDWTMVSASPCKAFDKRPIAFPHHPSGRTLINCSRSRITGTPSVPRPDTLPPLTNVQKQSLDTLHHLATRRAIEIKIQPGDMIFFNNLSMLHARDAFVDNEAEGHKRHLLRLIIRNEEMAYELPHQLKQTWAGLYDHEVEEELLPIKSELFSFATSH